MNQRTEYVRRIVAMHMAGNSDILNTYSSAYGATHEREEGESNLAYIQRCAEQDFHDGEQQGAVFQEIYDEVMMPRGNNACPYNDCGQPVQRVVGAVTWECRACGRSSNNSRRTIWP